MNIKEHQLKTRKGKELEEIKEKYETKIDFLEAHYQEQIDQLQRELKVKNNGHNLKSCLKSERSRSSKSLKKEESKRTHRKELSYSVNYLKAEPEWHNTKRDDDEWDTDITPAEELNSIDKERMMYNAENIGNESLLVNFYKKKLEDQKNESSKNTIEAHNFTHRASGPLKARDENQLKDGEKSNLTSIYLQSSSHRNISGYVPKHYQIPIKNTWGKGESRGKNDMAGNLKMLHKKHIK